MESGVGGSPRSSALAWVTASLAVAFAVGLAAWTWKRHPPSVDDVVGRVTALAPEQRHKICAHRANNLAMYDSARRYVDCVEIDIHVSPPSGGIAAVYHPPHSNNHGLTLEKLLAKEELPVGSLWLDTKDLGPGNWTAYLGLLDRLVPPARRHDVVVETKWWTPDVAAVAATFRRHGYSFSYYLPTRKAVDCAGRDSPSCEELRRRVLGTLSSGFTHLSFDADASAFVKSIRGDMPPDVGLLAWDLSRNWRRADLIDDVDLFIVYWPGTRLN